MGIFRFAKRLGCYVVCAILGTGCSADDARQETAEAAAAPLTNATPLKKGEHPYAAFLTLHFVNGTTHACSGTLVAERVVLTAAHCVICSTSIEARFFGQPSKTYASAPGGLHVGPLAYPDAPDCSLPDELLDDELNTKTKWGGDVAIVELAEGVPGSIVPPLAPLLVPPYGFSPVQDLRGQQLVLVGRGRPSVTSSDISVMRQGLMDVDRYQSDPPFGIAASLEPFVLVGFESDESVILPGDSGGPMIAQLGGVSRVIGVASGGFLDIFQLHAPTFTARNARFLMPFVEGVSSNLAAIKTADSDGDDVPNKVDNCPLDANTDQLDYDEDGVGDLCDVCMEKLSTFQRFDDQLPADLSAFSDANQANCNGETEHELLFQEQPALLQAGTLRNVTKQDYSEIHAAFGDKTVYNALKKWRRGDRCDPIPCGRGEVETQLAAPQLFTNPVVCGKLGQSCQFRVPAGFAFTPIRSQVGSTGTMGVRYCPCSDPHATESERRLSCGSGSEAGCTIDADRYSLSDLQWRTLTLDFQPPTVDVLTGGAFGPEDPNASKPGVAWNALQDTARLTGTTLPSPPWTLEDDGTIQGVGKLRGITWVEVTELGASTFTLPAAAVGLNDLSVSVADLAASYFENDPRISKELSGGFQVPAATCHPACPPFQAFPWEFCPQCAFGPIAPWISVVDVAGELIPIARTVDRTQIVDDVVSGSALQLLALGVDRVQASEPEYRLRQANTPLREVHVDRANMEVVGSLIVTPAGVVGLPRVRVASVAASGGTSCSVAAAGRIFALSAFRSELYTLFAPTPGTGAALCVWEGNLWSPVPLTGDAIGTALAAAFRLEDSGLYVLDRKNPGSSSVVRLLRVDLTTNHVRLVHKNVAPGGPGRVSLGIGDLGELVVASSRDKPKALEITRFVVESQGLVKLDSASLKGQRLAGELRATAWGVHYLDDSSGDFVIRALPWSSFAP